MKCVNCGKEIERNAKIYCSEKCHYEYWLNKNKKKYTEIECLICKTKFIPVSILNKYCSKKCKYISDLSKISKKPSSKICNVCGKLFEPYTSLDKFCSANCRINNQKSKRSFNWTENQTQKRFGENNPAYRNGTFMRGRKKITVGERIFIKNSKELKQEMINDFGFIYCENCNTAKSLRFESHHLIYRSEKPEHENLHKKVNLIILCIKCHNEFHRHKSLRNEIVNARHLENLFGVDILHQQKSYAKDS